MKTLALLASVIAVGCQTPAPPAPPAPPEKAPPAPAPTIEVLKPAAPKAKVEPAPPPSGDAVTLRVFAAPIVVGAVRELARVYGAGPGGGAVEVESGGLYDVLKQIGTDGGDVIVTEGWSALEVARTASVLGRGAGRTVTHLELAVTLSGALAGEAKALSDLDKQGVRVGIADPSTTTGGQAARRLMARAGLARAFQERTLPSGADTALKDGTVDAWIGWGKVKGAGVPLALPGNLSELLPIPAAVTALSKHPREAAQFVEFLASDAAAAVWAAAGTVPRPDASANTSGTVLPGKLPSPRRSAGAVMVGERVLLVGGDGGGVLLDALTWYDPATLLAEDATAKLPSPRFGAAVGWSASRSEVAIAGGIAEGGPVDDVFLWDTRAGSLQASELRLPLPLGSAGGLMVGTTLFVVGGRTTGDAFTDAIVKVDLVAGTTTRLATGLPAPRASVGIATGDGGRILVVGGEGEHGPVDELVSIDPATGKVEVLATHLDSGLAGPSVVPWRDGWLILGGRAPKGSTDAIVHLGADKKLATLGQRLTSPLEDAAAVRIGEAIWVLGGLAPDRVEGRIVRLPN